MDDIIFNETNKKCSFCGEDIRLDARRCPYCGSLLGIRIEEPGVDLGNTQQSTQQPEEQEIIEHHTTGEEYAGSNSAKAQAPDSAVEEKSNTGFTYYDSRMTIHNKPLGNGTKVFMTVLCTIIPGLGQLIGIIAAIVYMNSEEDPDRRSFGAALLASSLVVFLLSCILFTIVILAVGSLRLK